MIMANDLFTSNAQYGNAAAPNTIGTAAGSFDGRTPGASYTPGSGILNAVSSLASNVNPTGLIGGALNLIGGISQRAFERREAEKQREWNEQMMRQQNEWSLEQWNRTNEYNTPAAQRQRLLDAGLNPMYYGLDGNGNAGAFESAQALGYDRANAQGTMNPIAGALEGYQTMKQMELMEAQIANTNANTAKQTEETATEVESRNKIIAEIDKTKADIQQAMANVKLTDKQRENIEKTLTWLDLLNEAELHKKEAEANLTMSQRRRIEALLPGEKLLQLKSIEDFDYQWRKIDAEIGKISKETGLLEKDIRFYALNHMNSGFMGTGLNYNNIYYKLAMQEIEDALHNKAEEAKVRNEYQVQHGYTDFPVYPKSY